MTSDIAAEDHAAPERLVRSGRFSSVAEAMHDVVQRLTAGRYRPSRDLLNELTLRYGT